MHLAQYFSVNMKICDTGFVQLPSCNKMKGKDDQQFNSVHS